MTSEEKSEAFVRAIVKRLCLAWGVGTYKALTTHLMIGDSTPSSWINKGKIPFNECYETACKRGCTMDWLIMGAQGQSLFEPSLIVAVQKALETASQIDLIGAPTSIASNAIAKLTVKHYKEEEGIANLPAVSSLTG